jgi:transcriptional regulator with XRE-family HTH domain
MIETPIKTKDPADDRDRVIGLRVKAYRDVNGLSQTELGQALGVSFQQIQKYESGRNKISVSRLIDLCTILKTPLNSFLSGLTDTKNAPILSVSDVQQDKIIQDIQRNNEVIELLRLFNSLETSQDKKEIMDVLRALVYAKKKRTS